MAASSSRNVPVMPGSFDPRDYIHEPTDSKSPDDALELLAQQQETWRHKEHPASWVTKTLPDLDLEAIRWYTYNPPSALRNAPQDVTGQTLLDIVNSSIDNIQKQADEERRRRAEEDERQRAAEEEARLAELERQKSDEPYLPIIMVEEVPVTSPAPVTSIFVDAEDGSQSPVELDPRIPQPSMFQTTGLIVFPPVRPERSRFKFFDRLRNRGTSKSVDIDKSLSDFEKSARAAMKKRKEVSPPVRGIFGHAGANSPEPQEEETVECVSCLDDFPATSVVKVPCHSYCADCFVRLISAAVQNEQQWPPKCCLNRIPFRTILRYVPEELKKTFKDRSSEWEVPVAERIYCSRPECGLWIKPSEAHQQKRKARCDRGHWTCTMCRGQDHGRSDCPQDRDMNLTNQLAEEEGWKRCFSCRALVEHKEACQHMTCRCGTQFCYVCGSRWRTCSCTMDQLNDLKVAVEDRRQQRQAKEDAEAEELRQILVQIEQFEREEALKAEIARQEAERLEEERQRKELQRRARAEIHRRKEVEDKFTQFRAQLDILHDLQLAMVEMEQETEATTLGAEAQEAKQKLDKDLAERRTSLLSYVATRLERREHELRKDFAIRSAAEKKLVDEYHNQLVLFWSKRTNSKSEIQEAMAPMRKKMDDGYQAWQRWKDENLDMYKEYLEEKKMIKEELMWSAEQRLQSKGEDDELELVKKGVGEMVWLKLVSLERERLLGEMEVQEMEGEADDLFAAERGDSRMGETGDTGIVVS